MPTPSDTFANEWTNAEAWHREHPELEALVDRLTDVAATERIRWMAVARTVTALEGEVATFTLTDNPANDSGLRCPTVGTVVGRALSGDVAGLSRWLVLVRHADGQVWALPEEQVIDIGD